MMRGETVLFGFISLLCFLSKLNAQKEIVSIINPIPPFTIGPPPVCQEGERVGNCDCDLDCPNYDGECPKLCIDFIAGVCLCQEGYVRETSDSTSRCIPKETCPLYSPECERKKQLIRCNAETRPRCSGCDNSCASRFCETQFFDSPRCLCAPGYVRQSDEIGAPCIPEWECPRDEEVCYENLPTAPPCDIAGRDRQCCGCDLPCETLDTGAVCDQICVKEPRCFCKPGYFSLTGDENSVCVPQDQCYQKRCGCKQLKRKKKQCECNEEAKCVGCDQPCAPVFRPCEPLYYPEAHCFCSDGYLRFFDGKCKPADQCLLRG